MSQSADHELHALASDIAGAELPLVPDAGPGRQALVDAIAEHVGRWLRTDRQRLANALYRIDVPERAVDAAISEGPIASAPARIAELIVARLEQKLARRARLEAMLRGES